MITSVMKVKPGYIGTRKEDARMSYSQPAQAPFNPDGPIGGIYESYRQLNILNRFREGALLVLANESAAREQYLMAQRRISRTQSSSDLERVAKGAGRVYAWSFANSKLDTLQNALALLCRALVECEGELHDPSCDAAAGISQVSADWFFAQGAARHAAILLTAKATAIGAKRVLPQCDIDSAREAVKLSFQYKSSGSLDWHYSVFAAATIESRARTDAVALGKCRKQLARSISRLVDVISADEWMVAMTLLATIERRLFDVLVENEDRELFDRHKQSLRLPTELENLDLFREMLRSNPAAVGHGATPDWLPPMPETSHVRIARKARVLDICNGLRSALDVANVSMATEFDARAALAQLEWKSEPTNKTYLSAVRALGSPENAAYPDEYLADAIGLWAEARSVLRVQPPADLLRNIARCHDRIFADEQAEIDLVRVNSLAYKMRLVACGLARHELWSESMHLIDATRRVMDRGSKAQLPHDGCRVHVTHDPEFSFVIIERPDGTVEGRRCSIGGRSLVKVWYAFGEDPGVTVLEEFLRDSVRFRAALQKALDTLGPIIDTILELASGFERIALEPAGIYYRVPLASLIELAAPGKFKCISICFPQHDELLPTVDSTAAISVSGSIGFGILTNSDNEARNVAAITTGESFLGASSDQILSLLSTQRVVHFLDIRR